jgi:GH24 family phage-related lysozyme (muramidase)
MKIDFAVKSLHLRSAIQSWNNSDSDVTFTDLTQAQQTVIFSRTFHQGIGMPNTLEAQNFYSAATQGNWQAAETALRNYPVSANWYKNRVGLEADLLLKERTR